MTDIERVMINGRWPLNLPTHRANAVPWPYWEATRLAAMHHFIQPGDVIYDIGAEAGDFGALFATWGARPVLIEPNPKAWPTIKRTFEANDLVPLLNVRMMLSDRDDTFVRWTEGWPGEAYDDIDPDHGFHHIGQHKDPTTTVDILCLTAPTRSQRPDILTMDVEGGEGHVIRGAHRTLTEIKPAVFASLHPQFMADLYGETPKDIHDAMKGYGYRGRFLAEDHEEHWYFGHPDSGREFPGLAEDYYIPGERLVL